VQSAFEDQVLSALDGRSVPGFHTDGSGGEPDNVCRLTAVARFVPDSGGYDLVSGFALFVEVAALALLA
jgi:urease alpha subunit